MTVRWRLFEEGQHPTSGLAIARLLPYLFPVLIVFPSVVWIAQDTSAWGGDQSQYGLASVELFRTLMTSPQEWPRRMLDIFPYKPNGLVWLGQAFVPVGYLVSSIDRGLMLGVIVLQVATLILLYHSVRALSSSRFVVPATACLVVASAPIFILFAHNYLVESYQVMSVAWFILIMSLAPTWNRSLRLVQLTAATAFAMSAKEIQPLFCIWPGLVACFYMLRRHDRQVSGVPLQQPTWVSFALAIPMALGTFAWYIRNFSFVREHLYAGAYGPAVKTMWGKEDTYFNTVAFWIETARTFNFLPGIAELSLLIIVAAAVMCAMRAKKRGGHFALCAGIAALQVITVVIVFSLSPTRQPRYLLPVLPYIAVLIAWSVTQLNRRVTALVIVTFAIQFVLLHGQALNVMPVVGRWVGPVNWNARSGRVLDAVVARTCERSDAGVRWNILAVDPSIPELAGDWLAPEPANYVVAKQRLRSGGELPCQFGYLGDNFFGSDVSSAWESILSRRAQYVIVADQSAYPTPAQVFNQALSRDNFPVLLARLETSDLFEREPPLPQDSGILIFRRVDNVAKGRALSDRGLHDEAVVLLRKATTMESANAEAWANLAFAYERRGSFEEAIAAAIQARHLNPEHYYVDMILARTFFQEKKWGEVIVNALAAESHAPGQRERVDAVILAATAAFRSGNMSRGCEALRGANLEPTSAMLGDLPTNVCQK